MQILKVNKFQIKNISIFTKKQAVVTELSTDQFQQKVLNNTLPCVVEIYTLRCPKCKILEPIFNETAKANEKKFSFYKINASKNMDIAKKYKVLGVPTLLFFRHGILVDKKTGVLRQDKIEKRLIATIDYSVDMAHKKEVRSYIKLPWK